MHRQICQEQDITSEPALGVVALPLAHSITAV